MHKSCLAGVRAFLVSSAAILSITAAAAAQNTADVALQPQPTSDALSHITHIMFRPEAIANLKLSGVVGWMEATQAVNHLTRGSNLEVVADGWDGLIVCTPSRIMTDAPTDT